MRQNLPTVRIAQPSDVEEVVSMCRRLHNENGVFALNEAKVRNCLQRCFDRAGTIVGVIGAPGSIEASTCMEFSTFYYTDDWHLSELWNFVEKDHRHGTYNAEALIDFCKKCADHMQMPLFTGIVTNKQMAGKVRLYRRLLGYPVGAYFLYNSHWRSEPMTESSGLISELRELAGKAAEGKLSKKEQTKLSSALKNAADTIHKMENLWGPKQSAVASVAASMQDTSKRPN